MTIKLDIKSDIKSLQRRLRDDQKVQLPKMINQAINRTMTNVETHARKVTAKAAGIPSKDVRERMTRYKSTWRKLGAAVEAFGGRFNLARFKARATRVGVSATAWGKRKVYEGTFFAFGQRTVFVRKGRGRLPIKPVYGPGVPDTLARDEIERDVADHLTKRWPINLEQAARRYWAKK